MKLGRSDYAAKYAQMYESELMEVARDYNSLTEPAQAAIRLEIERRGLSLPEIPSLQEAPIFRELVTIRRYRDLTEAEVAKSALESAGIRAELFDDNLARMNWFVANAIGGVRLQVDAADNEAAEAIVSQGVPQSIAFGEAEHFEQPTCPSCGSINVSFQGRSRKAAIVSLYLLSLPVPTGRETWVCADCDTRWEDAYAE